MRTLTTLLVSFFVIQVAFAQTDTIMLSLEEVQKLVIENNVEAKNARLTNEKARMQSLEIITTGLPQITGSANYIYNYKQQKSIIPAGAFSPQELEVTFVNPFQGVASIELQQLLVDGRYFLGLKANKAITSVGQQQERLVEIALKSASKGYYINALVARRANTLLKESYVIVEKSLNDVEALFAEGLVEDIEVDRIKLRKSILETQIKNSSVSANLLESLLKFNAGLDQNQLIKLTTQIEDLMIIDEIELENAVSDFKPKDKPEYKLLLTQYELKGYDKKQTALGYAPGLYGSLSYGAVAFGQEANLLNRKWFGFGSLGLSLQVPIFDSYRKGAQYQQKRIDQEIVFNNLKNYESASVVGVKNVYSVYITNLSNYKVAKENFELAKKIYDKSDIKYKNGIGSSVELAQADGTLAEERAKFINATGALLISITNLENALGKIK